MATSCAACRCAQDRCEDMHPEQCCQDCAHPCPICAVSQGVCVDTLNPTKPLPGRDYHYARFIKRAERKP